jgi:hypothetical protein
VNRRSPSLADEPERVGVAELALPQGFEIAELAGKNGGRWYAIYSDGRRVASGMTSVQSALRWAKLMAGARTSSAA